MATFEPETPAPDPEQLAAWRAQLERYCAWQERSPMEIDRKMYALGIPKNLQADYQAYLAAEGFADTRRFALTYARSKFRQNRWGRNKILAGLLQHHIPAALAMEALATELEPEPYTDELEALAHKKWAELLRKEPDPAKRKQKLIRFLAGRGYEISRISQLLPNLPGPTDLPDADSTDFY